MAVYYLIKRIFKRILLSLIALLIAGIVVTTLSQVISRYVFSAPLVWTEELARYLGIWCVMLTAGVALGDNMHIGLELIIDKLKWPIKKAVFVFNYILVFGFCVFIFIYGVKLLGMVKSATTPAMGISIAYVYAAIPVGGLILGLYAVLGTIKTIQAKEAD